MADADNDTNDLGVLSQEDLDALIAGVEQESAEEEVNFGAAREEPIPPPLSMAAGMVDLPSFDLPPGRSGALGAPAGADGLGRVRDIPLEVTVELGRTRLLIRDILDLSPGSIIELDKIAGEPVDLFANGLLIARGEVIVIDDNFGVRVTEIITAAERKGSDKESHALAA
jgi:flagellar motor switch protein FliN/FliY